MNPQSTEMQNSAFDMTPHHQLDPDDPNNQRVLPLVHLKL